MDAELVQLAREAVAALQAGPPPNWVEVAQLFVSGVGLACIVGGLFSMKAAGKRRDREIDELAAAFRNQGEAMTQAFTQQGQALERQGQVLAELLRRTE